MKLSFKGIFRQPHDKYEMLNHYKIYKGWWIEERTVRRTGTYSMRHPEELPNPEFRIYASLRHGETQDFRGLVSGNREEAERMIDSWGQRGYVVQHFLKDK